jgi:hypothetical protein
MTSSTSIATMTASGASRPVVTSATPLDDLERARESDFGEARRSLQACGCRSVPSQRILFAAVSIEADNLLPRAIRHLEPVVTSGDRFRDKLMKKYLGPLSGEDTA